MFLKDDAIKNNVKSESIILEDNLGFSIDMDFLYNINQGEYISNQAYTSLYGFVVGYKWEVSTIQVNTINNNIEYVVYGALRWNLCGINIYSQLKIFKGNLN